MLRLVLTDYVKLVVLLENGQNFGRDPLNHETFSELLKQHNTHRIGDSIQKQLECYKSN